MPAVVKFALTDFAAVMVTEQVNPEQSPDHPVKVDPAMATAVRVTPVPEL